MTPSTRPALYAACALVLALSVLVYAGAIGGGFVWDDYYIMNGQAFAGARSVLGCFSYPFLDSYYRPLAAASLWSERRLWGHYPLGYHLTNLALHAATTALLLVWLRDAFASRRAALAGALLFAVQPAQIGAVAWIGGRPDALCALWSVGFAWSLTRALQAAGDQRSLWLVASVLLYTAALFTKEQTLALLPLVPLAAVTWARKAPRWKRTQAWTMMVPFALAVVVFLAIAAFMGLPKPADRWPGMLALLAQMGRNLCYYALHLLAPTPGSLHTLSTGALERTGLLAPLAGWGVVALVVALAIRLGRADPPSAWFLLWTGLLTLPVSGLLPLPFLLVAPYRAALPGIGVAALLGRAFDRLSAGRARVAATIGLIVIAGWWAGLTAWGATRWSDDTTLFRTIARWDPDSMLAQYNVAHEAMRRERYAEAVPALERLLALLYRSPAWQTASTAIRAFRADPAIESRIAQNQGRRAAPRLWLGSLFARLGVARLRTGAYPGAAEAFRVAEALAPDTEDVQIALGIATYERGDYRTAEGHLRAAETLAGHSAWLDSYLGHALAAQGRWAEARSAYAAWVREAPDSAEARRALANAQAQAGRGTD